MFLIFNGNPTSKCFFCSYLKSILSTIRELIFTRTNFCERILKLFFFIFARISFCEETYCTYFARIKFSEYCTNVLPVAVTFSVKLKKDVYKASQKLDLQDSKLLLELNFPNFANWQIPYDFSRI